MDRQAHVILDAASRGQKAAKILSLLGHERVRSARRILEIGCGSGIIASELARASGGRCEVHGVDVADNRVERDGYQFQLVADATLPFATGSFDIVVSNYVIEHVASDEEQAIHLREIERVLAPSGVAYLGLPNKWRLVEPHFRLPLLSWFPRSIGDRYVRLARRGTRYDCLPLSFSQARSLLEGANLRAEDITVRALRETLAVEHGGSLATRIVQRLVPDWLLRLGMPLMPVYIFLLTKPRT